MKLLYTLCLTFLLYITMSAQWTTAYDVNTLVTSDPTSDIESIGDHAGNTFVIYWDETAGYQLKIQKLDNGGFQQFGSNGMIVNNTAPMSTYTVTRDQAVNSDNDVFISFTATGDNHGYAHKISNDGTQLWPSTGVDLGLDAYDTKILPLDDGGAIIGYINGNHCEMIRYDTNGNAVWTSPVSINAPTSGYTQVGEMTLLSDGSFIVLFHVKGTSWGIDSILWAQRYDANGIAQWANPVQISNNYTASNRRYQLLSSGMDAYLGYFGSIGTSFNSFVQKIASDGSLPWGINGVDFSLDATKYEMNTSIAIDPTNAVIWANCLETNTSQGQAGTYIQKLDMATGVRQLSDNALEVFPLSTDMYVPVGNLQLIGDMPYFLLSKGNQNGATNIQLAVCYLNNDGTFQWSNESTSIATSSTTSKWRVDFTNNFSGQSVAVWVENRGTGEMAYAQNVIPEDLGVSDIEGQYTVDFYPNPVKDKLHINTSQNIQKVNVYSANGALVRVPSWEANTLDVSHLEVGVYWVEIRFSDGTTLRKQLIKK